MTFLLLREEIGFSALDTPLASKHKIRRRVISGEKTTTLTMYPQVVNSLPQTNATDEIIADREGKVTTFILAPNKAPSQYAEEVVARTLRCGDVYKEQNLNENFIKGLNASMKQIKREYWSTRKHASLHRLAHPTSL